MDRASSFYLPHVADFDLTGPLGFWLGLPEIGSVAATSLLPCRPLLCVEWVDVFVLSSGFDLAFSLAFGSVLVTEP